MEASGSTPRRRTSKPAAPPEETPPPEGGKTNGEAIAEQVAELSNLVPMMQGRMEEMADRLGRLVETTIERLDVQDRRLLLIEESVEPEPEISLSEQVAEIDQRVGDTLERVERAVKDAIELQAAPKPNSLALAKADVMAELGRVEKRGQNLEHGYDYATVGDIAEEIRKLLGKHRLSITVRLGKIETVDLGVQTRGGRQWVRWRVDFTIELTHGPTGESETVQWVGFAEDFGDKGLYKCMSGGVKYWMIDTFLVSTGDDPEATNTGDVGGSVPAAQRGRSAPAERSRGPAPRNANAFADPDARRRAIFGAAKRAKVGDDLLHEIVRYRLGVRSINDVEAESVELVIGDLAKYGRDAKWRETVEERLEDARRAWDAEDAAAAAEGSQAEPSAPTPEPDAEGEPVPAEPTGEAQDAPQEPTDDPEPEPPDSDELGVRCPDCQEWLPAARAHELGISLAELVERHNTSGECIPF
jgi:hypothetical protein